MSCAKTQAEKHAGKWPRKKASKNGARPKGKMGQRLVSYCPLCRLMVGVTEKQKTASCKAGHTWELL